jgi:hypothetical protein
MNVTKKRVVILTEFIYDHADSVIVRGQVTPNPFDTEWLLSQVKYTLECQDYGILCKDAMLNISVVTVEDVVDTD